MNTTKKQHFIPEMLSKRFARPDGKFFFHDRRLDDNLIRPSTPNNILHQRYLYSPVNAAGERDFSLEVRYSRLEAAASELFDQIEQKLDAGKSPVLSAQSRRLLDHFIYEQWRRVPDMHARVLNYETFRSRIETAIVNYEQRKGPLPEDEKARLIDSLDNPDLLKGIPGRALKKSSGEVLRAFQEKSLVIAEASRNSEYIIGSSNVIKTSNGPTDLRDASVEVWLAFTPRFAAVLLGRADLPTRVQVSADQIHDVNREVAAKSSIIASKNLTLIQALRPGSALQQPSKPDSRG
ncbi:uncharacterized protein DUF4238 [Bradyrhizobium macuxiense]|uniref:Uncharacterized protein DUF4238 n=1 Tax=Bradyrhizobium macuxiense TaxID=1755647 RepID=A0A560L1W3_9BRAD|nr:DUF4238 domain-containing protein [Bradyrhizobium macuxiense]TWB89347.1 uncharacterized protein DUF4238 [Bradyrhizobium macuxiense]